MDSSLTTLDRPTNPVRIPQAVINPFTRKPVALSKGLLIFLFSCTDSIEIYKSNDDDVLKDLVGKCQVLPEEVNLGDIDSLYAHQMVKSIVAHFYPLDSSLERNNSMFFIQQSVCSWLLCKLKAIVADALLKLNRLQEARSVVEKAISRVSDSPNSEVGSLPGEIPTPVGVRSSEFSNLLSILDCEISTLEGKQPLTQLYTLLEELWSFPSKDTNLIFRVENDICSILLKNCQVNGRK